MGRARKVELAAYLALGVLVVARYLPDPGGRVSGRLAIDNTWFEWLLAHGAYSVRHLANPFFSVRQNAPDGVNMMANTSVLGVTLPLAPLTMLLGAKIVYLVWVAGAAAATAATTSWALRRHLGRSPVAGFLGGALAGFAPGVIHHANGQPNFVSNFLLPVILVRVLRLGAGHRAIRDGLALGALVTWQVFINEELLLVTAFGAAVTVLAYAVQEPAAARRRAAGFGTGAGVAAAVTAVLCAYPLWMQFAGPQGYRALPQFHAWGEDLAAFVSLAPDSVGGHGAAAVFDRTEQNTWFGWALPVAVTAVAVVLWRRGSVPARTATMVAVVFALAALGPQIRVAGRPTYLPGPWALVGEQTPVLGLMMPSRLAYAVIGAVVVLVALGWDAAGRAGRIGLVAALLPLFPVPVPVVPDPRPPHFITSGAWRPFVPAGTTLVPVPLPDIDLGRTTLSWSVAARQEFAVPCGYFLGPDRHGAAQTSPAGGNPTAKLFTAVLITGAVPAVTAATRAAVRADLARWRASVVVLGPQPAEPALRALLEELLGPGERHDDVRLWEVRR